MGVMYRLAKIIMQPPLNLVCPIKKLGYKEEPFDGPTIVLSNHISNFDVFVAGRCFKNYTYFLCKKEAFKNKVASFFVKGMGGVKIDRENPDLNEIKACLKLLKEKKRLLIFPEGTRNKKNDGNLLPLKSGAGMFAFKSKARIIPMFIPEKSKFLRRSYVYIGEPFFLDDFYGKRYAEVSGAIDKLIENKILECRDNYLKYIEGKSKK